VEKKDQKETRVIRDQKVIRVKEDHLDQEDRLERTIRVTVAAVTRVTININTITTNTRTAK
jgi:hypothetical protein